jgi:hypothetical protein
MTDVSDYRSLPPEVQAVLKKYRIIGPVKQPDGTVIEGWSQADLASTEGSTNGRPLGMGPLLDPNVIARFLAADKTPNHAWLDWMMFHSGGGKEGQKRSEHLLQKSHALFIEERVKGYTERVGGREVVYPPKPRAEVEKLWKQLEPKFRNDLAVGDQDLAAPPRSIFGYYRHWPGKGRIYERVATAVNTFQKLEAKAKSMNKVLAQQGDEEHMVSFNPKDYASVDALEAAIKAINQFHASKHARSDIKVATVYDDDFLTVLVPLTYAAAVRYGLDSWAWSNRKGFEDALRGGGAAWNNPWKNTTGNQQSVFVYILFKTPMPPWVAYSNEQFRRHELDSVTLVIPANQLTNFNEDTIKLYDSENRANLTLGKIKQQIRDEPKRVYDPEKEEHPVKAGPPVYKDDQEAEQVVQHLDAGLNALKQWGATFNPKQIVSDFMPNT